MKSKKAKVLIYLSFCLFAFNSCRLRGKRGMGKGKKTFNP
ncbi:hypothetical protein FDUTEX481_03078 [Tolypothrix sp. PCC 7601]|nr:hypothetical protein FDUTEX481_03078 [Tolypothrix sp. PCC 7601]